MKKVVSALTFAAISILMFSCIADKEFDNPTPGTNEDAQLVLRLKTPQGYSPARSRSLSYADENSIDNIWVLVFNQSNMLTAIRKGENVLASPGHADPDYSGAGSFSVTLSPSATEFDTYNLVVLANAQTIISNTIEFDVAGIPDKSYASVMAAINAEINGPMYPSGGVIPMWGESGGIVVKPGSNNQTLQLTRSVARIDVGVGKVTKNDVTDVWSWDGKDASEATIPFVLDHVYVIKPNDRYAVAPDASKAEGEPTVPSGTQPFPYDDSESNFGFAATGGHTSRDIYVPEADIKMGASASSGDANHTNRMAIVVGGRYNGSQTETFYRLDFAVGGDLVNVLRNHLYQFNISKVSGDGFPNVETAYNSLSMNMSVDIYEWNEKDMGLIVFDGQYYLSVSQDEFSLSCEAISTKENNNVLYVETDYKTTLGEQRSGWYVEKIEYAEQTGWITPTPNNGDAGEKSEVILAVTENDGKDIRRAVIWIAAGRMRYPVTVTQTLAPALGIQLTDGNNNPVTELVFASTTTTMQTLKVNWQPKTANLTVVETPVGADAFSGTIIYPFPSDGIISNSTGSQEYTIITMAFDPDEIDPVSGNPFLERISKLDFTTTNGISYANKSLFLRQIHYNLLTDAQTSYVLEAEPQSEKIHVRANFPWRIIDVSDTNDILSGESALIKQTGGNNTDPGDEVNFTLDVASTNGSKEGKTATITFLSLVDGSEWPVTITAADPIIAPPAMYVGYFGGKLTETDGVWQFERKLYVQQEDESGTNGVEWARNPDDKVLHGAMDYTDGRGNTYHLHSLGITNLLAAELCYNKNTGAINSAADLTWYLPALQQLIAIWVVHESFDSADKFSTSDYRPHYWSSTESYYNEGQNISMAVTFISGSANSITKQTSDRVRCVRE